MKTKIIFRKLSLFTLAFSLCPFALFAQVPKAFNYQAVVRSGGTIVKNTNLDLRLSILQGSETGTAVWTETQSATTNDYGLVAVQAGSVTPLDVDWSAGPYYLKAEVDLKDGNGFTDLGAAQMLSVPYALQAGDVGNLKGLKVQGNDLATDSALFEVKRKDGQTVFAVYNEGVRIYVDTTSAKGPKGGFAIGGFGAAKGPSQEYMLVTPDSVRVYIDQSPGKGPKGGFAIGGFGATKGATTNLMHLTKDNYFIGHQSGIQTTTGLDNVFIGYQSGFENVSGNTNVFLGFEAGYNNTSGSDNVLLGYRTGYNITTGQNNINIGSEAGYKNELASDNIFLGRQAGYNHIYGNQANLYKSNYNIYIGHKAGYGAATGDSSNLNIFIGNQAGYSIQSGSDNVFIGDGAGYSNVSSHWNVYMGLSSGKYCLGAQNVFIGGASGAWANGTNNCYIGAFAGRGLPDPNNNTGYGNVFMGYYSGIGNLTGSYNVFLGTNSAQNNGDGNNNVYIGYYAANQNNGTGNVFIGYNAGKNVTSTSDKLIIANSASTNLIEGSFADKTVTINDALILTPRASFPANPVQGELVVLTNNHVYCYLGGVWKQLD